MPGTEYQRELGGALLRSVSRSFYLTLRFLPGRVRGPASLGYLLARATDTVADTETVAAGERVRLLGAMGDAVAAADPAAPVAAELSGGGPFGAAPAGEVELLGRFGRCLGWLADFPDWQRAAVQRVMEAIVRGQGRDLQRFPPGEVTALGSDAELEEYIYDVAGCVGVFWTDLGAGAYGGRFARRPRDEIEALGASYGKGLQLLNVLRDLPEDWRRGRCYLPGVDPAEGGEAAWAAEAPRWRERCRDYLVGAADYIDALRGPRLRFATALPALIGGRMLAMLERAGWDEVQKGVKVPRAEVKRLMARAALASVRPSGLGRLVNAQLRTSNFER